MNKLSRNESKKGILEICGLSNLDKILIEAMVSLFAIVLTISN